MTAPAHVLIISCEDADELYKTARVMGNLSQPEHTRLLDHAHWCERSDWHHAIWTSCWPWIERERARMAA